MRVKIGGVFWIIIIAAKSYVALFEDINLQGVPVGDNDPHSNVQLAIHDYQWVLDVLLDDPGLLGVDVGVVVDLLGWVYVVLLALS